MRCLCCQIEWLQRLCRYINKISAVRRVHQLKSPLFDSFLTSQVTQRWKWVVCSINSALQSRLQQQTVFLWISNCDSKPRQILHVSCNTCLWLSLTDRLISHANIPGSPAAKSTGQVIGFLHGSLGWVIREWSRNAGGPGGKGVHAAGAVKAVSTPVRRKVY